MKCETVEKNGVRAMKAVAMPESLRAKKWIVYCSRRWATAVGEKYKMANLI